MSPEKLPEKDAFSINRVFCKYCKEQIQSEEEKKQEFHNFCHKETLKFEKARLDAIESERKKYLKLIEEERRWKELKNEERNKTIEFLESYNLRRGRYNSEIRELNLNDCKLENLPDSIGELVHLRCLKITLNNLTSLPKSIGKLTNLKELDIGNNQLLSVPDSIGLLTNLRELNLSSNQLSILPSTIKNMKLLNIVFLKNNKFQTISSMIFNLPNLIFLDLSDNQISTIKIDSDEQSSLINLLLTKNQITSIPKSIKKLTNLKLLDLSYNQLNSLPDEIKYLKKLTDFRLLENELITIPESIGNLINLKKLNLENNRLITIPESIGKLMNLEELTLGKNNLNQIPITIENCKNLKILNIDNNQIDSFPNSIEKLERLYKLFMNENKFKSLPESIDNLRELKFLYISNNQLSSLPNSICNLFNLRELNLKNNQLINIPNSIGNLKYLRLLNISGNHLVSLPESISKLSLKDLNVSFNQLTSYPLSMNFERLEKFEYRGNNINPYLFKQEKLREFDDRIKNNIEEDIIAYCDKLGMEINFNYIKVYLKFINISISVLSRFSIYSEGSIDNVKKEVFNRLQEIQKYSKRFISCVNCGTMNSILKMDKNLIKCNCGFSIGEIGSLDELKKVMLTKFKHLIPESLKYHELVKYFSLDEIFKNLKYKKAPYENDLIIYSISPDIHLNTELIKFKINSIENDLKILTRRMVILINAIDVVIFIIGQIGNRDCSFVNELKCNACKDKRSIHPEFIDGYFETEEVDEAIRNHLFDEHEILISEEEKRILNGDNYYDSKFYLDFKENYIEIVGEVIDINKLNYRYDEHSFYFTVEYDADTHGMINITNRNDIKDFDSYCLICEKSFEEDQMTHVFKTHSIMIGNSLPKNEIIRMINENREYEDFSLDWDIYEEILLKNEELLRFIKENDVNDEYYDYFIEGYFPYVALDDYDEEIYNFEEYLLKLDKKKE